MACISIRFVVDYLEKEIPAQDVSILFTIWGIRANCLGYFSWVASADIGEKAFGKKYMSIIHSSERAEGKISN
jgi:hypothetical protein